MRAGYARSWSHNKFSQFGVCTHGITTPWPKPQTSIPSAKFDCPVTRQGKWLITEIMCVWYGSHVCSADREYLESDPRSYEVTKEVEKKALLIIVYYCLSLIRVTLPNNNTPHFEQSSDLTPVITLNILTVNTTQYWVVCNFFLGKDYFILIGYWRILGIFLRNSRRGSLAYRQWKDHVINGASNRMITRVWVVIISFEP